MCLKSSKNKAFTLIELSIVLVIIGLIVGGVLVGRDLINAATVRAQIAQIEGFNTATNTFRGKYGYLPGDIPEPDASRFGFIARGSYTNGNSNGDSQITGILDYAGEPLWFWIDLSTARLIPGSYSGDASSPYSYAHPDTLVSATALSLWFPPAKIGNGIYVYVYNNGYKRYTSQTDSTNYFCIASINALQPSSSSSYLYSYDKISVTNAYNIDKKMDDGKPQYGKVLASHLAGGLHRWSGNDLYGQGASDTDDGPRDNLASYVGDDTSCYHNPSSLAQPMQYALTTNGNLPNCSLSFKFQ